jgi:hypothetical protein
LGNPDGHRRPDDLVHRLIVVVRFIPHRIGPNFFRLVNAILGLILLGFATFCAVVLSRHFLH